MKKMTWSANEAKITTILNNNNICIYTALVDNDIKQIKKAIKIISEHKDFILLQHTNIWKKILFWLDHQIKNKTRYDAEKGAIKTELKIVADLKNDSKIKI